MHSAYLKVTLTRPSRNHVHALLGNFYNYALDLNKAFVHKNYVLQ